MEGLGVEIREGVRSHLVRCSGRRGAPGRDQRPSNATRFNWFVVEGLRRNWKTKCKLRLQSSIVEGEALY